MKYNIFLCLHISPCISYFFVAECDPVHSGSQAMPTPRPKRTHDASLDHQRRNPRVFLTEIFDLAGRVIASHQGSLKICERNHQSPHTYSHHIHKKKTHQASFPETCIEWIILRAHNYPMMGHIGLKLLYVQYLYFNIFGNLHY